MTNRAQMKEFESKKNIQASGYTTVICILLAVVFLFVKWTLPTIPPPPIEEGIEVNLGNSEQGLGEDQPFLPGPPAPVDQRDYTPPKATVAENYDVKDVETDDRDEDAPSIVKPAVVKPEAKKIPEKEVVKKTVNNPQPVSNPVPPAPKPKAVFRGVNGTGSGGNEADTYKKGDNQGIAGGKGDQGQPAGNPNSGNYEGGGRGNSGVAIARGLQGRYFTKVYSYEGDFNENAKVAVDVRVNKTGTVLSATYQPRGSTTANSYFKEKAVEIVRKSKLNADPAGAEEQTGTVTVNFKVKN